MGSDSSVIWSIVLHLIDFPVDTFLISLHRSWKVKPGGMVEQARFGCNMYDSKHGQTISSAGCFHFSFSRNIIDMSVLYRTFCLR
jgi:hypothetical protein